MRASWMRAAISTSAKSTALPYIMYCSAHVNRTPPTTNSAGYHCENGDCCRQKKVNLRRASLMRGPRLGWCYMDTKPDGASARS